MATFTVSGQRIDLERGGIEESLASVLPEPIQEHYVVVEGRRFPPKQVLACVTGLDRADFTTHQARRILRRLGFVAARAGRGDQTADAAEGGGGQAEVLRPFIGKWVALETPTEVLVAADSPQEVLSWLARHERRATYGMFRVPSSPDEAGGAAPA